MLRNASGKGSRTKRPRASILRSIDRFPWSNDWSACGKNCTTASRNTRRRMVVTLLVDANLDGHAELLAMRLATDTWREWRDHLDIQFRHFEQAGLERNAKDDTVWRFCQEKGY